MRVRTCSRARLHTLALARAKMRSAKKGFHERTHPEDPKMYNTHAIVDAEGVLVASYRKMHLFDVDYDGLCGCSACAVCGMCVATSLPVLLPRCCLSFSHPTLFLAQGASEKVTVPTRAPRRCWCVCVWCVCVCVCACVCCGALWLCWRSGSAGSQLLAHACVRGSTRTDRLMGLAHVGHTQVKNTPVGNIGVTICYDLRFPELYTALRCPHLPRDPPSRAL